MSCASVAPIALKCAGKFDGRPFLSPEPEPAAFGEEGKYPPLIARTAATLRQLRQRGRGVLAHVIAHVGGQRTRQDAQRAGNGR